METKNVVGYSIAPPSTNILMINDKLINGRWDEGEDEIVITVFAENPTYSIYGDIIYDNPKSREDLQIISDFISVKFKDKAIEKRVGWSTKNQFWSEWKIKK